MSEPKPVTIFDDEPKPTMPIEDFITIEEYAIELVTRGAESSAEDDSNEDGKIAEKNHEAAIGLALDMVDAIRTNPHVLLELTALHRGEQAIRSTERTQE